MNLNPMHSPDLDRSMTTGTGTTTGSWAQSTHSVIWRTNTGTPSHRMVGEHIPWRPTLIACAAVALTVLLACANLVDVYGSFGLWAAAAVPAALIGSGVAAMSVLPTLRVWWQLVALVVAQWILGPVICCNGTTLAHVVPTAATLRDGWSATFGSFKYLISIAPPVGSGQGALMAVWTLCLWGTTLAGFFAVMRDRRWSFVTVALLLAISAASALLGTDDGWMRVPAGVIAALVLIVWMAYKWGVLEAGRWLSSAVIMVLAAVVACGGCLLVGQQRVTLRDHYDPPLSPYDYASPLSGMRAYIKEHKDTTLLTVQGLPAGTPVRLAVMDRFDGNVWNLPDRREARDSSNYVRVGTRIPTQDTGRAFDATFTVHEGLHEDWLPLAGTATGVRFADERLTRAFYYNTGTDTGLLASGVRDGLTYTESGVVPAMPTDQQIAGAKGATVAQPQAQDVPQSVGELATAIAGGRSNGGEAAQALAETLKDRGWFSHGLASDYPSLPGHGNFRLTRLLAGTAMVGDSEQYASAMALMARELGLSSRVVLGFLPKDGDGEISDERTQTAGGTTTIDFTGNDVTAWVEINLVGHGWVPFYPTPKETKTPDDNQNLTPPNPQSLVRQPPVPLTDPLRDEQNTTGQSSLDGDEADETPRDERWARVAQVARAVAVYGSPVWTVLLVCALILAVKAAQLAWLRRHGRPGARIAAGWRATATLARQSGVQVHGTRREQSQQIADELHLDPAPLNEAVREADYVAFSGVPADERAAEAYWKRIDALRGSMLAALPRWRRWRTRLSLRGLWHSRQSGTRGKEQR